MLNEIKSNLFTTDQFVQRALILIMNNFTQNFILWAVRTTENGLLCCNGTPFYFKCDLIYINATVFTAKRFKVPLDYS